LAAGAVGLQDALQAHALFVGGDFAGGQICASIESSVERGGALFENGNAAVVIGQQAFDPFQETLDRVEAFVHRVAQVVDALALVKGGDGERDDDGQGDLNERLLPPVHTLIVTSLRLGFQARTSLGPPSHREYRECKVPERAWH